MNEGTLPEKYLGVPLISGKVTKAALTPLIDKIRTRASGWAGKMLSFQGRVVLARHVLNSIHVHNMAIYKWPKAVVKECETIIRNFIWSGNPAERKAITVSWEKSCKPTEEGGLGIRRLKDINLSMLMKQAWILLTEEGDWPEFMRGKYINRTGGWSNYKTSTVWTGIKWALNEMAPLHGWNVGNGEAINIWRENWLLQKPICDFFQEERKEILKYQARLSECIQGDRWAFSIEMTQVLHHLGIDISKLPQPDSSKEDSRVWMASTTGKFIVVAAHEAIRTKAPQPAWSEFIWSSKVLPRTQGIVWKLAHGVARTNNQLQKRKTHLASRCCLCRNQEETLDHVLFHCPFAKRVWKYAQQIFHIQREMESFSDVR
ncbi:hypothetical protein IFM89_009617 [Coptis chinensis]|uniref:Reverse transcriptase zinc-binding domain-containing protein n=1 Tax=Coptis chinensis TaxID=261450 RepID=A0A835IVB1_9MAGN|nr:hypothetical protein IFM89_009617 [Coptis chinensis]